jgi:hypothetical protein
MKMTVDGFKDELMKAFAQGVIEGADDVQSRRKAAEDFKKAARRPGGPIDGDIFDDFMKEMGF